MTDGGIAHVKPAGLTISTNTKNTIYDYSKEDPYKVSTHRIHIWCFLCYHAQSPVHLLFIHVSCTVPCTFMSISLHSNVSHELSSWHTVPTDYNLLLTLLRNLIENAFRFSDGQKVIVKIERSGNCCRFGVADSGRGMTQEEIRRAAEPFYKADKSRSAAGYGIGLSICKSICTLFKTELKFESELGRGTCVSFDLEVTE